MNKPFKIGLAASLLASAFSLQAQHSRGDFDRDGDRDRSRSAGCFSNDGSSLKVVGLTADQRLICFDENQPDQAQDIGTVSGLQTDTALVGIDYRVQDGKLYGLGNAGGVYRFEQDNPVPTFVNRLTVPLDGTSFGVDFNPPADRLRVTSDKGQNLRHNVNAGGTTIMDDPLDYPPLTPVNAVGPTATGIGGSAYTNNDLDGSTATTLYALDSEKDQVAIQSPPNDGTLAATGQLTVDTRAEIGFDIYSTIRDGVTVNVQALASLTVGGGSGLYSVRLTTGKATLRGYFANQNKVIGIAIPLKQL